MNEIKRLAFIVCGTACVALGVVGIFLPLLPTTPFLLLAAFCYARSSMTFYTWLITNRWCGEYIRNYREGRGISRRHKVVTITLLWLTIGYTAGFVVSLNWVKLILFGIACAVTLHLTRLKTFSTPPPASSPTEGKDTPNETVVLQEPLRNEKVTP
jgi:uncharacterized membrane protein YbaN (DUF454 family)